MLRIQLFVLALLCPAVASVATVRAVDVQVAGGRPAARAAEDVTLTLGLLNTVADTALTLFGTASESPDQGTWAATGPGPTPVWRSPLHLTWGGDDLIRYNAGFDASYSPPAAADDSSMAGYLHGDRFRAWLRSGLEWNYIDDAVLALGARWSPIEFAGGPGQGAVQAAATVTVPW